MKISGSKILFFVFVAVLDYSNCNNYSEILMRENVLEQVNVKHGERAERVGVSFFAGAQV